MVLTLFILCILAIIYPQCIWMCISLFLYYLIKSAIKKRKALHDTKENDEKAKL